MFFVSTLGPSKLNKRNKNVRSRLFLSTFAFILFLQVYYILPPLSLCAYHPAAAFLPHFSCPVLFCANSQVAVCIILVVALCCSFSLFQRDFQGKENGSDQATTALTMQVTRQYFKCSNCDQPARPPRIHNLTFDVLISGRSLFVDGFRMVRSACFICFLSFLCIIQTGHHMFIGSSNVFPLIS